MFTQLRSERDAALAPHVRGPEGDLRGQVYSIGDGFPF